MTKYHPGKGKHMPQRTCVGCRQVLAKQEMTRIVATADGVQVDLTGKKNGRGAYLHNLKDCWQKAINGSLSGALRRPLTDEDREHLTEYMETLP
jgi:predicted RNA-binding protein YlxR (DUF448 family)